MVRVLRGAAAGLLALALLGAAPNGPIAPMTRRIDQSQGLPRQMPGRPPIDWDRTKRNTQEYQLALSRHRAELEQVQHWKWPKKLLDSAQTAVPVPSTWDRLMPPSAPTTEEQKALELAGREVGLAQQFIDLGARDARARLEALEVSLKSAKHKDVLLGRLEEERALLEQRVGRANQLADAVRLRIIERDATVWGRVKEFAHNQTYTDAGTELVQLRALINEWKAAPKAAILSADLSYVKGSLSSSPPAQGQAIPAYQSGTTQVGLEDTTQGREVELSPDIEAQAQALGTPKAAYDFVKNQVKLDWYYGLLKGSTETLREKRGNDADLATLLIALLRAQGYPARFVRGTVQLPIAKVADLMGLLTAQDLQQLYVPQSTYVLPATRRNLVLQALSAAGIPYQPIQSGGQIAAIQLTHVWVEAFIPYADYRGAGTSQEGKQWVPMDPGIPGQGKYAASPSALDAIAAMKERAPDLTAAFLATQTSQTAMEFFRAQVQQWLAQNRPDVTYAQLLRTVQQQPETLNLIPGTLPYKVIAVLDDVPFLPDDFKHQVHITVSDATGPVIDTTLPMHQMLGHRSTLTYKPASEADQEAIQTAGGLYKAPASIVQVLAAIRLDGVDQAVATRPVGLGVEQSWTVQLVLPGGGSKLVQNTVVAGNLVALGFGGPQNGFVEPTTPVAGDQDGPAPVFMYGRAVAYANGWTASEEELAQLVQVVPLRPTASVVFVENQLEVQQVLGVNQQVNWKGLEVDADLRTMTPLELVAGRGNDLLRLSGYEGSSQENKVLTDGTGEAAVSAVTVIQNANATGVAVLDITTANQATLLPTLSADPAVVADVLNQLARGREVLIPQSPQTIQNWTGTGYIATNPTTQEAGYFLSGIVSGGMTIVSPEYWTDPAIVNTLVSNPARTTNDVSLVARIMKLPSTDMQEGVVGQTLRTDNGAPMVLMVAVTTNVDSTGNVQLVSGATVTFQALLGTRARPQLAAVPKVGPIGPLQPPGASVSTVTDESGIAKVAVAPGKDILADDIERLPKLPNGELDVTAKYLQLFGWDSITAQTLDANGNAIILAVPFHVIGDPDVPSALGTDPGHQSWTTPGGIDVGTTWGTWLSDQYGNPLANYTVNWNQTRCMSADPPTPPTAPCIPQGISDGTFFVPAQQSPYAVVTLTSIPPQAALDQTTDEIGSTDVGYIPEVPSATEGVQIVAQSNGVTARYFLTVQAPEEGWAVLRDGFPLRDSWDGIKGTFFPAFVTSEILSFDGSNWAPVAPDIQTWGSDPVQSFDVRMEIRNSSMVLVDTLRPTWIGSQALFLPQYELGSALQKETQYTQTKADIEVLHGGQAKKACCDRWWFIDSYSGVPTVEPRHVVAGQTDTPLSGLPATTSDLKVGFLITNPGSEPLYAQVTPQPTTVVTLPGCDKLPCGPGHGSGLLNYFAIAPLSTDRLFFDVKPSSPSGSVGIVLRALDFDRQPNPCGGNSNDLTIQDPDGSGRTCLRTVRMSNVPVVASGTPFAATLASHYFDYEELSAGSKSIVFDYAATYGRPYDEIDWSVVDAQGAQVASGRQVPPTGSVVWDGRTSGGALADPGKYSATVTALIGGTSNSGPPLSLTIYRLQFIAKTGVSSSTLPGRYILVNNDDDDLNGTRDLDDPRPITYLDPDMIEVDVKLEPVLLGAMKLTSSATAPRPTKVWQHANKDDEFILPASDLLAGDSEKALYVEGAVPGQETLSAQFTTDDGAMLNQKDFALTSVSAEFVEDTNRDFRISENEGVDNQLLAARPMPWDYRNAFGGAYAYDRLYFDSNSQPHTFSYFWPSNETDENKIPVEGEPWNWIGGDSNRFYLRVIDPTLAGPDEPSTTAATWWTAIGSYFLADDAPSGSSLTLISLRSGTGAYASEAVGIVSDDDDVSYPTNDGWSGTVVGQGGDDHRTRRITVKPTKLAPGPDNRLVAAYAPPLGGGQVLQWSVPVFARQPEERRLIRIHVFNFRQPQAGHDYGTDPAWIAERIEYMVNVYASAGIMAVVEFDSSNDLITVPDFPPGTPEGLRYDIARLSQADRPYPPPNQDRYEPPYSLSQLIALMLDRCHGTEPDAICVGVVLGMGTDTTPGFCGESYSTGVVGPGSTAGGFSFMGSSWAECQNLGTMAHEVGHQLLNYEGSSLPRGEYVGPLEQYNLMFAFDDKSPRSVIWPKRIWAQQRDTILLAPWTEDLSP